VKKSSPNIFPKKKIPAVQGGAVARKERVGKKEGMGTLELKEKKVHHLKEERLKAKGKKAEGAEGSGLKKVLGADNIKNQEYERRKSKRGKAVGEGPLRGHIFKRKGAKRTEGL